MLVNYTIFFTQCQIKMTIAAERWLIIPPKLTNVKLKSRKMTIFAECWLIIPHFLRNVKFFREKSGKKRVR